MVTKAADSSSKCKKSGGEQAKETTWALTSRICQLKKQIQAARFASVKEKIERNGKNLEDYTSLVLKLAKSRNSCCPVVQDGTKNMLSFRIESALCKFSGSDPGPGGGNLMVQEEAFSSIVLGNNGGGSNPIRLVKLPFIEKIPPYTTWIFLSKNQRMAEDQSVVGRRQIYYDQYGSEALICSDSEEEVPEPGEEKHEFSEGEDQILWKVLQEHGLTQEALHILSQFIDATTSDIQERYDTLKEKNKEKQGKDSEVSGEVGSERNIFLDKSLSAALDSFDNLFCRRCLVFDCRLHGCSQGLVIPSEKLPFSPESEENGDPCSDHCYLRAREGFQDFPFDRSQGTSKCGTDDVILAEKDGSLSSFKSKDSSAKDDNLEHMMSETSCINVKRPRPVISKDADMGGLGTDIDYQAPSAENIGKCKVLKHGDMSVGNQEPGDEDFLASIIKKQKKTVASDENDNMDEDKEDEDIESSSVRLSSSSGRQKVQEAIGGHGWNPIEKELFFKGLEIFGRNSCLIARNLLAGLKTCIEVANYMLDDRASVPNRSVASPNSCLEDNGKGEQDYMEFELGKLP